MFVGSRHITRSSYLYFLFPQNYQNQLIRSGNTKKKSKTWDLEELEGWLGARGAISWKRDEQIKNLRASRFRIFAHGARIVRTLPLTKFKQNIGIRGNYKKSDIFAMKRHKRCTLTYRNIFASWSWLGRCHIHQAQSSSSQLISQKRCASEYFK